MAEQPLPPVPKGITTVNVVECSDVATGEQGQCTLRQDAEGNIYIVFRQEGTIMFIRQVFQNAPPVDLWVADRFASY
jgi:hypothetical protein